MIKSTLRELLGRKRWNQAKLARVAGLRPTTISELGRDLSNSITFETLDRLCETLECQPGDLFCYEPNEIPKIERNAKGEPIRPIKD